MTKNDAKCLSLEEIYGDIKCLSDDVRQMVTGGYKSSHPAVVSMQKKHRYPRSGVRAT